MLWHRRIASCHVYCQQTKIEICFSKTKEKMPVRVLRFAKVKWILHNGPNHIIHFVSIMAAASPRRIWARQRQLPVRHDLASVAVHCRQLLPSLAIWLHLRMNYHIFCSRITPFSVILSVPIVTCRFHCRLARSRFWGFQRPHSKAQITVSCSKPEYAQRAARYLHELLWNLFQKTTWNYQINFVGLSRAKPMCLCK